ncbi:MAG: dTDP-4-dehydrorhamnose 3,5-epimerase [Bacteroidales bacterium]|nr:dTDP-4-dehydrorhamnose 3,5-epimerase [Bacteroidales bacterium]
MEVKQTAIEGVWIIKPKVFTDKRGYFVETFSRQRYEEIMSNTVFVQDNESGSMRGVVRGLHFQKPPYAQSKLVRAVMGEVLDVAVDLREGSSTFGQHTTVRLSSENKFQLFIPRGFAHGFAVLSESAILQYKCDNYYAPEYEETLLWNDPILGIDWLLPTEEILLSEKDKKGLLLKDLVGR